MVQLKSFKYIEPDGRQSVEATVIQVTGDQQQQQQQQQQPQQQADDQQLELDQRARSVSSESPESTLTAGGNLTISHSSGDGSTDELRDLSPVGGADPPKARISRYLGDTKDQDEEEDVITLSSQEEYQTAKLDMSEDEADERSATQVTSQPEAEPAKEVAPSGPTAASNLPNQPNMSQNSSQNPQPTQQVPQYQHVPSAAQLATPRSSTPDVGRYYMSRNQQLKRQLSSPVISSMSPQVQRVQNQHLGGNSSPLQMKRQWSYGDNVSQLSFGGRSTNQPATQNQFEIRWHNLNLMARRSKLPSFIGDSQIYKLFKSFGGSNNSLASEATADEQQLAGYKSARVYYSPPIQHKGQIPPTIREVYELSEKQLTEKEMEIQEAASESGDLRGNQEKRPTFHTSASADMLSFQAQQQSPSPQFTGLSDSNLNKEYRPILVNVSGSVFSGQMSAILGPSGVGKTMLLNTLTGRNMLQGTGKVSLIGSSGKRMSVVTVPQADVLPGKLTTMEDLKFTSRLKNPQANFDHERNISRIVKCLQMEKFLHTRIERLSGGEERRLSIGRELLSSPDILILDEPTSGLDANTCKKIISALRDIVEHSDYIMDRPMSIIVTIHQPQQEVLNLFHRVYVMAVGGRVVYEGPPTMILPTLIEHSSLSRACQVEQLNENPAIVALEVASGEYGPQIIAELANHHEAQFYEDTILAGGGGGGTSGGGGGLQFGALNGQSPFMTPRVPGRRSPMISSSPRIHLLNRGGRQYQMAQSPVIGGQMADVGSIGRPTPLMGKRFQRPVEFDKVSQVTSISYASTYDAYLPDPISPKLKVDKRLRRSVVMKSHFWSHTWTLMQRCWLLTTRDMFLMCIRIVGFVLVAMGMVQTFAGAIDPNEHQCPEFETEVSDVASFMDATKFRLQSIGRMLRQSNTQHLFLYHLVLSLMMVTSALTGLMFPFQMRMFTREYKNGWYSPASFIMSTTLAELPVDFIGPTISVALTYSLCNQPAGLYYWREIGYVLVIIVASLVCKSQAQIAGAAFMDSVENSVFSACVAVTGPALLSGIAVRVSQMSWPLQLVSCTSFLRFCFESLFVIRYGYGICPCDPETIHGYPARIATEAIPAQLDNLARGIIELNTPTNDSLPLASSLLNSTESGATFEYSEVNKDDNMFVRYLRLVNGASNLFVPNPAELGNCDNYRSLYLMDMGIPNGILPAWLGVMLGMWVFSRFLTYFTVRTVIKFRRKS